jgi:ankyrin repeat protein
VAISALPGRTDFNHSTCGLRVAAFRGLYTLFKRLLDGENSDVNRKDAWGFNPLIGATVPQRLTIPADCVKMVKLLLDRKVDIAAKDKFGRTAFTPCIVQ